MQAAKRTAEEKRHKEATELAMAQIQTQVGDDERIDENDSRVKVCCKVKRISKRYKNDIF